MINNPAIQFCIGSITASGSSGAASNSGGGSGGSILIHTRALEGSGVISVNGGNGNAAGGGGGGGRMAIYWQDREWWYGGLNAFGGRSTQGGNGGPGTVYLKVRRLLRELKQKRFERRTSTGSGAFSLLIRLDDIKFVLLIFFALIDTI